MNKHRIGARTRSRWRRCISNSIWRESWSSGQNAKTLVKYDDFRVVLTALRARARLPGHQTE
jgi:hypothetical protein